MKTFLRIISALFVFLLVGVVFSYLFLLFNAGKVISGILRSYTGSEVTFEQYRVSPSLLVEMKGIKSGESSIESLICKIAPAGILSGRLLLDRLELNGPEFYYHRESGYYAGPENKPSGAAHSLPGMPWLKRVRFLVKELSIKGGTMHFSDAVGDKPIKLEVKEFFLDASNAAFPPQDQDIVFNLGGIIPWKGAANRGELQGQGRVNWVRKNIKAEFKARGIDAVFFYPYYSSWINLEKIRIEKAKLGFLSELEGAGNAVTAKCRLELSDISFKPHPEGERPKIQEKLTQAVLDIFKGEDNKIVLDFTVNTSLDRPRFGLQNIKSAVEEKIETARPFDKFRPSDAVALSRTVVQGTFKGIGDLSKAVVSGVTGIGRAFREIFNTCTKKK